ncbi:MAG: DUF389 domain-containing protein [Chloroflexi bacterium]|nr:DUF389 domain-containing protein [Chloroflexota bacterium]
MTLSNPTPPLQEPSLPHEGASRGRARRRRRGQLIVPADAEGRAELLQSLARRAYPSYELFVFAVACGAIIGLGFVLDQQSFLVLGVLLAPLMTPWIGLLLAAITGSLRFFFETFMALLISATLVFLIGLLSGFAVRPFLPRTLNEAFIHSSLWWPDLIILAFAAIILTLSFVRSEEKPFLPSVMLAYELFVPLSAGGFGLGSGVGNIWPNGLQVFIVHFAWASLFGLLTLIVLRFLPTNFGGLILTSAMTLTLVITLILLMNGGKWIPLYTPQTTSPTSLPTLTISLPPVSGFTSQPKPSATPQIETATLQVETVTPTATSPFTPIPLTLEVTLPPTESPTVTLTIEPTPVYARILSNQGGGAYLRKTPNGKYLATLDNYTFVEVLPDTFDDKGVTWAHVIAVKNGIKLDGWVLQLVLDVATPVPNWQPSATPSITSTP